MDDQSLNLTIKSLIQEKAMPLELRLVSIEKDQESVKEFKTDTKENLNEINDRLDEIENSINEQIGQLNQIKEHMTEIEEKKRSLITTWIAPLVIAASIPFALFIIGCVYYTYILSRSYNNTDIQNIPIKTNGFNDRNSQDNEFIVATYIPDGGKKQ